MSDSETAAAESSPPSSPEKRGRGRPRKPKSDKEEEPKEKRPRGRPRGSKKKADVPKEPKKPRGLPRKAAGDVNADPSDK